MRVCLFCVSLNLFSVSTHYLYLLASYRNLFGTLLSLQPQIPSAGHGESREEKVIITAFNLILNGRENEWPGLFL